MFEAANQRKKTLQTLCPPRGEQDQRSPYGTTGVSTTSPTGNTCIPSAFLYSPGPDEQEETAALNHLLQEERERYLEEQWRKMERGRKHAARRLQQLPADNY